jgi:hypothetical protein
MLDLGAPNNRKKLVPRPTGTAIHVKRDPIAVGDKNKVHLHSTQVIKREKLWQE